jgi:PAS domain S-box-containing protein
MATQETTVIKADTINSTHLYSTIFDQSPDGMVIIDPPTAKFLEFNEAAHRQLGYTREEFAVLSVFDVEALESAEETHARIEGVLATGRADFETRQRTREGDIKDIYVSARILYIQGKPVYYCLWRDITARKTAEKNLHDIITKNPMAIQILDKDGFTLEINNAFKQLFGSAPPEGYSVFHDTQLEQKGLNEKFEKMRNGEIIHFPDVCYNPHDVNPGLPDVPVWTRTIGFSLNDNRDQFEKLVLMHENITERKVAEEKVREQDSQFKKLSANVPGMIYQFTRRPDGTYCVPIASVGIKEIYGCSPEDVVNDFGPIAKVIHPDDLPGIIDAVDYSAAHLTYFTHEYRVTLPGKETRWLFTRSVPEKLADGSVTWYGFNADITDRKQAEVNLRQIENRLRQSEKMEAIGKLAGGIAHDFNNILGGIVGFTDLSLDFAEKGSLLEKNLESVLKAADRAKSLVMQILAFSRQNNPQKSIISLHPVLSEVLDLLKSSIPSSVIIDAELHTDTRPVLGDPTQLHQVFLNLATNAVYAMNRKGTLRLKLYDLSLDHCEFGRSGEIQQGEYTAIEIADTGCGMDAATLAKACEPFFTTKPIGEGTGMGLSVVLGIIQSHGGDIQIESTVGKGTTIRIMLPVTAGSMSGSVDDNPHSLEAGTERILFVDDEQMLVEMNYNLLTALGYTVTVLSNSRDALRILQEKSNEIDLLITDHTMPGMTGLELAKEALHIRNDLPIILCTGFSNEVNTEAVEALGIDKFILKPYRSFEISKAVRDVLDAKKNKS